MDVKDDRCLKAGVYSSFMILLTYLLIRNAVWIRGRGTFSAEDPQNYHRIAIVYASDIILGGLILHKYPRLKIELATSLDHSVWFHHPVQADQWYLYVGEVERAAGGRSLTGCR